MAAAGTVTIRSGAPYTTWWISRAITTWAALRGRGPEPSCRWWMPSWRGGCDLRHPDGFRLAQNSTVEPSVRYRGASVYRVPGGDANRAQQRWAIRGAGRLVWRD